MKWSKCPECGSRKSKPLIYGLPSEETTVKAQRGEVILGGCVMYPFSPRRQCSSCKTQYPGVLGQQIRKFERRWSK
jgi:hypothetical protein